MRKWTLHDSSYLVKKLVPRVANPTWPSCKQDYNPFIWDLQIFGLGVQVGFLMNLMRLYWLYVLIVVFYKLPNGNHSDWLIIHGNPDVLAYQTGQITRDRERMTRSLKRSLIEILMVR